MDALHAVLSRREDEFESVRIAMHSADGGHGNDEWLCPPVALYNGYAAYFFPNAMKVCKESDPEPEKYGNDRFMIYLSDNTSEAGYDHILSTFKACVDAEDRILTAKGEDYMFTTPKGHYLTDVVKRHVATLNVDETDRRRDPQAHTRFSYRGFHVEIGPCNVFEEIVAVRNSQLFIAHVNWERADFSIVCLIDAAMFFIEQQE